MCGIVGFTGKQQAAPILLDGLSKLEYRGYDSAGLAVRDGEKLAEVVKAKGRLSNLIEKTDSGNALAGTCGIGHTRWATHGEPSVTNAHPHVSGNCTGSGSGEVESEVVGVHNGIIENYQELKDKLLKHGYTFYSQTDTEVVIKLVDYYYKKYKLVISRTQNENNPISKFGKYPYLNIDYLYSFKTYDGNEALFGILDCTNRIEIEKNVRHYYGKKGIEKSKTGEISRLGFHKGQSHGHFVMQTIMQ